MSFAAGPNILKIQFWTTFPSTGGLISPITLIMLSTKWFNVADLHFRLYISSQKLIQRRKAMVAN